MKLDDIALEVRHAVPIADRVADLDWYSVVFAHRLLAQLEQEGWQLVPKEPETQQWDGLARDIVFALDMNHKTPKKLFKFLTDCGREVPIWMREEVEMQALNHTISKGTRAVLIYKAMLAPAPRIDKE